MASSSSRSMTKENAPGCASGGISNRQSEEFSHFFPARAKDFAREGLEEAASPNADEQRGAKKQNRIKAGAALTRTIYRVLQVEPERKFVQCKSGTDSVKQRHQAAREQRGRPFTRSNLDYLAYLVDQQQQKPPHHAKNVGAADVNVIE